MTPVNPVPSSGCDVLLDVEDVLTVVSPAWVLGAYGALGAAGGASDVLDLHERLQRRGVHGLEGGHRSFEISRLRFLGGRCRAMGHGNRGLAAARIVTGSRRGSDDSKNDERRCDPAPHPRALRSL